MCIRDRFTIPRNVKALRTFLGLMGYYRQFLPLYPEEIKPLLELMRKDAGTASHKCIQQSQGTEENIMPHHPQCKGKYIIYSDASDYAIGSILYQEDEKGELRVIAYASSCLLYTSRCV